MIDTHCVWLHLIHHMLLPHLYNFLPENPTYGGAWWPVAKNRRTERSLTFHSCIREGNPPSVSAWESWPGASVYGVAIVSTRPKFVLFKGQQQCCWAFFHVFICIFGNPKFVTYFWVGFFFFDIAAWVCFEITCHVVFANIFPFFIVHFVYGFSFSCASLIRVSSAIFVFISFTILLFHCSSWSKILLWFYAEFA